MLNKFWKEVSNNLLVQKPCKHLLLIIIIKVVGNIMQEIVKVVNNNNAFSPPSIYVILNGYWCYHTSWEIDFSMANAHCLSR
jgi:hypothetical protein